MTRPFRVAVLISGGGTTLENLIGKQASGQLDAEIVHVVSSNPNAGGLDFARAAGINETVVDHRVHGDVESFSQNVFHPCRDAKADLVVMGGFLRRVRIPSTFVNRVINIHPSLIPAFCGKGMFGRRVHQAVLDYGCKISGCTVHFVDDEYDHGPIIAQQSVPVLADDTPERLAARVFEQECQIYPKVVNWIAAGHVSVNGRSVINLAGNKSSSSIVPSP